MDGGVDDAPLGFDRGGIEQEDEDGQGADGRLMPAA